MEVLKPIARKGLELGAVVGYRAGRLLRRTLALRTIANYHATDKGSLHGYGTQIRRGHRYTDIYEPLFAGMRDDRIALLEIGIGVEGPGAIGSTVFGRNTGGASLKTWREFFPRGSIYGIDINPAASIDGERVRTFVCDQSNRDELAAVVRAIGRELDIVIDDGSHASRHQQISLAALFPQLKPGGIYVVEDLVYQPPTIERPDDRKTLEVLKDFKRTGSFESPFVSAAEAEYLSTHTGSCRLHGSDLAVLRKVTASA